MDYCDLALKFKCQISKLTLLSIDNICILGIELDLAWSGGSCGEIHFTYEKISPKEPPLHARSSSIPGIRILSIGIQTAYLEKWKLVLNWPQCQDLMTSAKNARVTETEAEKGS